MYNKGERNLAEPGRSRVHHLRTTSGFHKPVAKGTEKLKKNTRTLGGGGEWRRMHLHNWPGNVVSGKHAQAELAPTGLGRFGHA